ncbi:ead/Ea22-like family protein [Citrobacter freundii]|uniref:ead/Ea22-like family protein n=1 Tax=Citrobacter freundii complex TaxID=1344959 RepID=UPI000CDD0DAB|nr:MULTISPECIES: ead/Ea22-like family protein [Citrobacter freundii complex]AYL71672.1 hypothetical protein CUC51_13515 [Citrobacter freundii]ELS5415960.1 ead/Ea22-like family protein [Citrobacter freundii]ELT9551041.1 ead/Ea22-like family protein [Citrobacter freundii]EMA2416336.1 ead/Ea22-like family protein [Citrobacter freundii]MBE9969123.1 ead/Ea22-like family protein [Citrobacter freundii]
MSNIDKQALREAAEKASTDNHTQDEWFHYLRCSTPETVLALLDELEARDKSISFLKDQLAQLANFNPDWDKLEAATDSLREHMAELTAARKRIAELSTSHSNLREAMAGIHNTITAGGAYTPLAAILNASKAAYEESAAAAGKGEAS